MGVHQHSLAQSWQNADQVYLYEPPGMDWSLEEAAKGSKVPTSCYNKVEDIVQQLKVIAQPQDHILVMSNGGFEGIHQRILDALAEDKG
ncbi:hypothetical protein KUL49_24660 [Alteromonas sp. KUL49]|nr:hypothetical protein KUL49_24660 [Alteromonas sp. KUL49]